MIEEGETRPRPPQRRTLLRLLAKAAGELIVAGGTKKEKTRHRRLVFDITTILEQQRQCWRPATFVIPTDPT